MEHAELRVFWTLVVWDAFDLLPLTLHEVFLGGRKHQRFENGFWILLDKRRILPIEASNHIFTFPRKRLLAMELNTKQVELR